jgi:signal transduction histidine kinase
MKSIRLSLIVYFLLLVAGALTAVSLLVYQVTARVLSEKQATNKQLLQTQYEQNSKEIRAKTDNDLLAQARLLLNLSQSQFEANRLHTLRFQQLGILSAGLAPQGQFLIPLWIAEYRDMRLSDEIRMRVASEILLDEELLHRSEDRATDLYQINSRRGRAYRSGTLRDRYLPFDSERFEQMRMLDWEFDDIELDGVKLRRVMMKAPIVRFRFLPAANWPRGTGGGRRDRSPSSGNMPPPPAPMPRTSDAPPFFIQCAHDVTEQNRALANLESDLTDRLHQSDQEAQWVMLQFRYRLLFIALATFAAVCVGGSILVGLGLAPLRRLSDAVSRVSEKDFRLQFDGPPPPKELVPIVERLQQTLTMLQRAFDREKQATADISHELRTPLAGLLTTAEVALRKPRSAEEYREALVECRDIVKQLTLVIQRLLTLSRLDAHTDAVRVEPIDVGELADQCAAMIRPLAKAGGLTLDVHKDTPVKIVTDPAKLREVISNLLHNAVEYNRPAGRIDLSVKTSPNGLDLEVRDTGIGIAPQHRDRVFERFFRADESRQDTGTHAGLGLAIVRGYVELMGGQISMDSEVGRGSTFRVHIPGGSRS